jgi:hypothetical protein
VSIVDELVCFASVGHGCAVLLLLFVGGGGVVWLWLMVSLVEDDDSGIFLSGFVFAGLRLCRVSRRLVLVFCLLVGGGGLVWGVGVCFSTESLILAQDERWRRA